MSTITVSQAQQNAALLQDDDRRSEIVDMAAVRWGGTITRIQNQAQGFTLLEIVSRPLGGDGRPLHNDLSDGRFKAQVPRFLDPEIIKVGRDITVLGKLSSVQSGKIGETDYLFPIVEADDIRLWKKRAQLPPVHYPYWSVYPYLYDDPFWHHR